MAEQRRVMPSTGPCGKVGYLTRTAARKAIKNNDVPSRGATLHVYRCPHEACNGLPWHLTRQRWS